jgi:hypothetical protein
VAVQGENCGKGGSAPAKDYSFFYGNGNVNCHIGTGFSVHEGIRSAVKRIEFVSDRLSYIITEMSYSLVAMLRGSLVTTAWHVLRLQLEGRPPDTEDSCEYIE